MATPTKIDKRSKAYRDANKKDKVHTPKVIAERLTESLKGKRSVPSSIKPKSIYEMVIDLQDWCRSLDERNKVLNEKIVELETKVG